MSFGFSQILRKRRPSPQGGSEPGILPAAPREAGWLSRAAVFAAYAIMLPIPLLTGNYYLIRAGGSIGIYVMLSAGLSIVAGHAGLLDLGYAGFYGIGAYVYALLASPHFGIHLPFIPAAMASIAAALLAAAAVSLPTLRLHGDYLAMVTLGFGQIVRILLNNADRPINITNGPNGIVAIDPPRILGLTLSSMHSSYVLIWAFALATLVVVSRLVGSKVGRAWNALREDETAASCMGVNVKRYRVTAFLAGAAIAGLAGALFASWQGAVFPQNFTMSETIALYCMAILGGIRSVPGIMLGVLLLQILPELLRAYSIYRMLIYGFSLVLLAVFRPQGLMAVGERLTPAVAPGRIRAGSVHVKPRRASLASPPSRRRRPPQTRQTRQPSQPVLEISGLTCHFGGLAAVSDVSFTLHAGEILGVIGPNGAGKTTLFNLITGLVKPSTGSISSSGHQLVGLPPNEITAMGIARTFQSIRLYDTQTVLENVLAGCHLHQPTDVIGAILRTPGHAAQEAEEVAWVRKVLTSIGPELASREADPVKSLSYPDRRRVEIARALATRSRVLLLDEPAAGMAPDEIAALVDDIARLRAQGCTIMVIEHHMDLIAAACDRVIVLDHGEKIAEGSPSQVAADPDVVRAYLGYSAANREAALRPTSSMPRGAAGTAATPVLDLRSVHAAYGQAKVLDGVDLVVYPGEIVALLGSNAAGKSTMLKTVMGRLRPCAGEILLAGQRIDGRPTNEIVRRGISMVPEGRRIFPELTVAENLETSSFAAAPRGSRDRAAVRSGMERAYELFPVLAERAKQLAGTLSGGEQQMLAIGRALVTSPALICMDEPSMGLAPIMVERVMEAIIEINRMGTAILLVEQNAQAALSVADRAYVIRGGRVVASGSSSDLRADEQVTKAYMA
ncbi:MAG: branched-chain amino acid ABC transporter ATP-binding protein/permease [Clostridia bacterium]|nr:branched-chain amino acid ABC transporter ATP-binding protein/permease [Clostridia bacterium]